MYRDILQLLTSTPASPLSLPGGTQDIGQVARRTARTRTGARMVRGRATWPHPGTQRTTRGRGLAPDLPSPPARRPGRLTWPVQVR